MSAQLTVSCRASAVALVLGVALGGTVAAAQDNNDGSILSLPQVLNNYAANTREQYIYNLLRTFRSTAGRDSILDKEDILLADKRAQAQLRALQIQKLMLHDLDGDRVVRREELQRSLDTGFVNNRRRKRISNMLLAFDTNGDGRITIEEVVDKNTKSAERLKRLQKRKTKPEQLLMLDPNGDGRLTLEEIRGIALRTFARFDKDGDTVLSDSERTVWTRSVRKRRRRHQRNSIAKCNLPLATLAAKVIVLSSYNSGALSSVTVAGQLRRTDTSTFYVEPGEAPIYVIATSFRSNIWNFKGATNRIERVVAIPQSRQDNHPHVGVIGVDRKRITFLESGACMKYFKSARAGEARRAKATIGGILKRPVSKIVADYTLPGAILPSGVKPSKKLGEDIEFDAEHIVNLSERGAWPKGHANATKRKRARYNSKGVLTIDVIDVMRFSEVGHINLDVKDVVAPGLVEAYGLLPGYQGTLQLKREGKIEALPDGYYLIKKSIARLPAGLVARRRARFILGKGINMPSNVPPSTCIVSEETGKLLSGQRSVCR